MTLANINVKSHYSLLKSTLKVDDIIQHALDNDFKYVSICDYHFLGASLELIFKAKKNGLIPIIGMECTIVENGINYNVLLYAKNTKGLSNLNKLSSIINLSDDKLLDYSDYIKNKDNIIIIVNLIQSNLFQEYLLDDNVNKNSLFELNKLFSNPYYFIFNNNEFKEELLSINDTLKLIASLPIFCMEKNDFKTHYLLDCISNSKLADNFELSNHSTTYLLNSNDFESNYCKEELTNLAIFLNEIEIIDINFGNTLPLYKETIKKTDEYLKQLSLKGLLKRLNNNLNETYLKRLNYELATIITMGYSNYFLIVYDYVLYAKKNNILVGPGRGSSAGSLVAYCLGITDVDPIKNNLFFERFLNPERISMPDIDVDFQDDKRDEIVEYLKKRYGHHNIAHIITYGTFQAKNSIRDLGRVLNIPNYRLDLILKLIPNVLNVKLKTLLEESREIQILLQSNDDLSFIYKTAQQIEGINRHISTHAAGIIITDKEVFNYAPVILGINNTLMIQYNMDYLENIQIYKMDILGLKNLSILKDILNDIGKNDILSNINLNDEKTLKLMSLGNTLGIFQFESMGVIKVLKKMGIDSINDMVATTALFRPGPMKYIDEYIKRKKHIVKYEYIHKDLEEILKDTYGIIIYQEQIMQICQKMAGFSLAKADIVRKGMAKKDEKILIEIKNDFIESSINNGYSKEISLKVYEMIYLFSNYGFNKAHAYSYALLGYYLAYLKANYPKCFFKSMLSANVYSLNKLKMYLYDMRLQGLNILNPDINISNLNFVYKKDSFILPLLSIKGIGESNCKLIVDERENNGEFIDYFDTVARLSKLKISTSIIQSLIYSGAFDCFEFNRKTMIENLLKVEQYLQIIKAKDNQTFLELDFLQRPHIIKYQDDNIIVNKEYELLGLYLTNHPLNVYKSEYIDNNLINISSKKDALVIIDSIKEIRTKKGELMAFVNVSDQFDNKTLVVFPNVYKMYRSILKIKNIVLIKGTIDEKDDSNIILKSMSILNNRNED